jgi:prepilin-type N-terminal cleavage/methylation domain-containing protein
MKKRYAFSQGFTLLELLVVIAILGILVIAGVTSFTSTQKKSRDTKRKNDLRQVSLSLEAYYNDKGQYPTGSAAGEIEGCNGGSVCAWGEVFEDEKGTVYMPTLPIETTSSLRYVYVADAAGGWYQLYARLENVLDSDIPKEFVTSGGSRVFTDLVCDSGTTYCNYGVSSSNRSVTTGRTIAYE